MENDLQEAQPVHTARPAFTVVLIVLLVAHLLAMYLWIAPNNPVSQAVAAPLKKYSLPWWQQSWSLFAPDPVHAAYYLEVRAVSADLKESEWVSASEVELEGLRSHLLPTTATNITNKLASETYSSYRKLGEVEKKVIGWHFHNAVWERIPSEVEKLGAQPSKLLDTAMLYDRATTAYATQFLKAKSDLPEDAYIQYRVRKYSVRSFDDRKTTENTEQIVMTSGRRQQQVFDLQDQQGFARVLEAF